MRVKLKRVILNPFALMSIMIEDTAWRVSVGIPKDAVLAGFTLDPQTQNLVMFVTHSSFESVDVENEVAGLLALEVRKVQ